MQFTNGNIVDKTLKVGEQSDGSLLMPSGEIITRKKREKIIKNSLSTPVRLDEQRIKDIILEGVASILISETGSGKTTELQQMIHEVFPNDKVITNIPLVGSTIGTASYVSEIMYAKTGDPYYILGNGGIGYRTGKGNSEEKRAQITNNTFGLDYLYLSLGNLEKSLKTSKTNVHIVLDEIHEKGEDFVFYFKKIIELSQKFPGRIKLYGASATVSDNYLNLLTDKLKILSSDIPIIKVDGRTFPIKTVEVNGADTVKKTVELYKQGKSVLVFQSGKKEINKTIESLKVSLGGNLSIFPFHSEISPEELQNNLIHTGEQKIFVSTNAARTGVTLDINSVVDLGLEKNRYYNQYGIPILKEEPITQDAYKQNKGRAGRKEEGIAIYIGNRKISELNTEAPSSVEIKVDEKKLLMSLLSGENILKNETKGLHNYLFNPNYKMLELSYEWMKQARLITEDEKLTNYGFEVLKLPIGVFSGRIIIEAIENGVLEEILPMVSIIENNGFIDKKFDFNRFKKNISHTDYSDLEVYSKIFKALSANKIDDNYLTESILNTFVNLGIARNSIELFKALNGEKKLYEVIEYELSNIGLNYKAILKIDGQIFKINEYLLNNEINVTINKKVIEKLEKNKEKIISRTLLSGFLHKMYSVTGDKKLIDFFGKQKELEFNQSEISLVNISAGKVYLGEPFIISGNGKKDDLGLLSFITEIDIRHIEFYENKECKLYKGADTYSCKDFSTDINGDLFTIPSHLIEKKDKQNYLSRVWLPNFLLDENVFFKKINLSNKNEILQKIQNISVKYASEIDPNNKLNTINKFKKDTQILELYYKNTPIDNNRPIDNNIDIKVSEKNESSFFMFISSISEYNKVLKESLDYLSNERLDTNKIMNYFLSEIILYLETNSGNYSNLIIFLKKINTNKSNNKLKSKVKEEFKLFLKEGKTLLKIKKRNDWLKSFILNLSSLLKGGDITFCNLVNGNYQDRQLLLGDPIIKETNLGQNSETLNKDCKYIKKLLRKIDIKEKNKNQILSSMQRLLSLDSRKYNRGMKNYSLAIEQLNGLIIENNKKNNLLKKTKNLSNAKDNNNDQKKINIENNNIKQLISTLGNFKKEILLIREIVSNINFNEIIFSENSIYTKKFLYNILIDIIFEGNNVSFSVSKNEERLESRLKTTLSGKNINVLEIIEIIKVFIINKEKGKNNSVIITKINNYLKKINNISSEYNKEELLFIDRINGKEYSNVVFLVSNIEGLLSSIYPKEIIKQYKNKIINFSRIIHSLSINNIDEYLKSFISSFGNTNLVEYGHIFKDLYEYEYLFSELEGYDKLNSTYFTLKDKGEIEDFKEKSELVNSRIIKIKNLAKKIYAIGEKYSN